MAGGVAVGASRRRHEGLSVSQVLSGSSQSTSRVIVLLRNQHANLPPTQARVGARVHALSADQQPLEASVKSSGGSINHSFHTVNAFAATVSRAERARLAVDPSVAEILPDTLVKLPAAGSGQMVRITPRARAQHHGSRRQRRPADLPGRPLQAAT